MDNFNMKENIKMARRKDYGNPKYEGEYKNGKKEELWM
jgi:hypothetical protein